MLVAPLDEGADGGRCGVEDGDLVFLDDLPEAALVRRVGCAFIHQDGGSVRERSVDDVAVTRDPADIGGAPVNVVVAEIEDILARAVGAGEVAAAGVEDSLGLAGGTAGVEDEERVLAVEAFRRAVGVHFGRFVVPPGVASVLHGDVLAGALVDDDGLDLRIADERGVHAGLQRNDLATTIAAVGRDDGDGTAIMQAVFDALRAEATEDDAMHRADAGTGEHGDGSFGNHRHVNEHAVPGLDALGFEDVGKRADFGVELLVSDAARVAGFAFPEDGHFVATAFEMTIHAVFADVDFGIDEPLGERRLPIEHLAPRSLPLQLRSLAGPEGVRGVDRFRVELLVFIHAADAGLGLELSGGGEDSGFDLERFEVGAHDE